MRSKTAYLGLKRVHKETISWPGISPSHTYSLHWINDSVFSKAVAQYLDEERRAVGREMEILSDYGPFKDLNLEERNE